MYTYFDTYLSPQTHPNHRSHRTGCRCLVRSKRQELGRTHPLFHPNIHQYNQSKNCKSQQQPSKQLYPPGQTPPPPRPPSTTSLQIKTAPSKCTNDDHLFGSFHALSLFRPTPFRRYLSKPRAKPRSKQWYSSSGPCSWCPRRNTPQTSKHRLKQHHQHPSGTPWPR